MRLAWTTDLHLDFIEPYGEPYERLIHRIERANVDAVLIGGDIANGASLVGWLQRFHADVRLPLYVVLGNHDYYHADVAGTRERVRDAVREHERLTWLREADGFVPIGERAGLIGVGGLGDARLGNAASPVLLNDFFLIRDLTGLTPTVRNERLGTMGREDAAVLDAALERTMPVCAHVVVLLHVPPFREAAWHDGRNSDDDFLPFFASGALGDVLVRHAARRPEVDLLVLCGHTHSPGRLQMTENLRVLTAGAEYGDPDVAAVLDVSPSGVRVTPEPGGA